MYVGCGRSDDLRQLYIADMCKPQLLNHVGPAKCYSFLFVLRGSKANSSGRAEHMGFVRHSNRSMCAMSALARHLVTRYTLGQHEFPLPSEADGYAAWWVTYVRNVL